MRERPRDRRPVRQVVARLRGRRLEKLEGRGRQPITYGNAVSVLAGGVAAYGAMLRAIAAARSGIAVEMYTWADDRAGRRFADAVVERAAAGVPVLVLLDAFGSLGSGALVARMQAAGVRVLWFHPLLPFGRKAAWNTRNHRKLLLVDGRIGFTGGMNIAEHYSAEFTGEEAWLDSVVRIEGPAVRDLARVFVANWIGAGGSADETGAATGSTGEPGKAGVQVFGGRGLVARRRLRGAHLAQVGLARREIAIGNAYFAPELRLLRALRRAARRGVKVRLLLAGRTDSPPVRWAGRASYAELLAAGIEIREVHHATLHAKVAVIDRDVLITGSANLDYRSFRHNLEIAVTIYDRDAAVATEDAFRADWEQAVPITLDAWKRRPRFEKVKEWLARSVQYWL